MGAGILSQTLFNSDDSYEYVMPVMEVISETETSVDQNGDPNSIITYYTPYVLGFKIMSENGTTLHSIEFPEQMHHIDGTLLQLNGKNYLIVSGYILQGGREGDKKFADLYYHIPSDGSKLELVRHDERKLQTTQKGKNLIISFDGDSNYDNIEIFDASGRKSLGRNIDRTADEVSVNISDLSQGTYILRATSQSGENMSCKIAIR